MAEEAVAQTLSRLGGQATPEEPSSEAVLQTLKRMESGTPARSVDVSPSAVLPEAAPKIVGQKQKRGTYFEGGGFAKTVDVLSTLQYLAAGVAAGKTPWEAIRSRSSWEDVLAQTGAPEGVSRSLAGIAMDVALDPAWLITPAKVASVVGRVGAVKKAAEAAKGLYEGSKLEKLADVVGSQMIYGYKVPKDVSQAAHDSRELEHILARPAIEAHKKIKALGDAANEPMRMALEMKNPTMKAAARDVAVAAGVDGKAFDKALAFAEAAHLEVGNELFKQGRVTKETLDEMTGRYLRRVYPRHEDAIAHVNHLRGQGDPISLRLADELEGQISKIRAAGSKPKRFGVRAEASAERTLTEAQAKAYGLISDTGYRVARGIQIGAQEAARAAFLNSVALKYASKDFKLGYAALPKSERLGALSEKFVPADIKKFVQQNYEAPTKWAQLIARPLTYWKAAKVALSPAPVVRNALMSNPILLNFAGVPFSKMPKYLGQVVKAYRALENPALLREASPVLVESMRRLKGTETARFVENELSAIFTHLNAGGESMVGRMRGVIDAGVEKGGSLYSAGELIGKGIAAAHAIESTGADAGAAVAAAQHALFDYSEVPPLVKFLRQNGIVPFAAFPYFAAGATARALWSRPAVVGRIGRAFRGVEAMNPDAQQERAVAPKWMNDLAHVFTPLKDKYGRSLVFDASYLLPFQDIADVSDEGGLKKALSLSPFATLIYDVANNRSAFTGREITPPDILTGDAKAMKRIALKKQIDYIYKFALPSWAPSLLPGYPQKLQITSGGYAFRDLEQAIAQRPDVFGRTKDWKAAAMGAMFGIKVKPFDVPKESQNRYRDYQHDVQAIMTQMHHVSMDTELSRDQKQGLISKLRDDLINVHRGFRAGR